MDEQKPNQAGPKNPDLDRMIDTALARYAAVEPRAGLEGRILANLRTEQSRVSERSWWRWGLAAALAAMFVVAIALALRPGKSPKPTVADHHNATVQATPQPESQLLSQDHGKGPNLSKPIRKRRSRPTTSDIEAATRIPKLDRFPSPQPLSEQEQILASYIHNYPKDAALIAEARMESLQKDEEERQREIEADSNKNSRMQ